MNAASGTRPVSHSRSMHLFTLPEQEQRDERHVVLALLPRALGERGEALGEETAEQQKLPGEVPDCARHAPASSISPPAIASSPSCFHFISPAAMSSFSTISRAMPSSPSCTASPNL